MLIFTFIVNDGSPPEKNRNKIEEHLIGKIGKGDMEAFDQFYYQTEKILYAYLLSLTKDHNLSLDIMQDTYVKFISAAHLYKPMGKPLAWLFTIGKNLFYANIRRENREVSLEEGNLNSELELSEKFDEEDRLVLQAVLNLLSQEEREIVVLYAVSGLKHKEIADHLGLKLSTCLSKYHRAIKKLRDYLEEEDFLNERS